MCASACVCVASLKVSVRVCARVFVFLLRFQLLPVLDVFVFFLLQIVDEGIHVVVAAVAVASVVAVAIAVVDNDDEAVPVRFGLPCSRHPDGDDDDGHENPADEHENRRNGEGQSDWAREHRER